MDLDTAKLPLGRISGDQLHKAYDVLSSMTKWLEETDVSEIQDARRAQMLRDLSNEFYTMIPHSFKRNSTPKLIETQ